jgi:hypothetical protein
VIVFSIFSLLSGKAILCTGIGQFSTICYYPSILFNSQVCCFPSPETGHTQRPGESIGQIPGVLRHYNGPPHLTLPILRCEDTISNYSSIYRKECRGTSEKAIPSLILFRIVYSRPGRLLDRSIGQINIQRSSLTSVPTTNIKTAKDEASYLLCDRDHCSWAV